VPEAYLEGMKTKLVSTSMMAIRSTPEAYLEGMKTSEALKRVHGYFLPEAYLEGMKTFL